MRCESVETLYLCPFCDGPLSPRRSEWFQDLPVTTWNSLPDLISRLWSLSEPSPRPTNRLGRTVKQDADHSHLQIQVCEQHEYEVGCLPLYFQYKWPTSIDFSLLVDRLRSSDFVLQRLLLVYENPGHGVLISDPSALTSKPTTRKGGQISSRRYATLVALIDKEKEKLSYPG